MRSVSIPSFKYHYFFTALQSSTFWKVLQITKLNVLFPTLSSPEGVLWLSFPSLFWKTSTAQSKFSMWEQLIKSSGKLKARVTVMFPWYIYFVLDGNLLFCSGTKLWLERFGIKDFQTSKTQKSADRKVATWNTVPDIVINWDGVCPPQPFPKWVELASLFSPSLPNIQLLLKYHLHLFSRIKL